jgi:folate-binding protein YgfZ
MSNPIAYAPLSSRALIAVGGADWRDFLQGLITQDVESLANGEARFAALLTPQGRLLFDLFVVGRLDGCWLDVAAEHRDVLIQRLMMYRLRAKVEIDADETPVAALFGDAGELAEAWIPDPRLTALGWRGYGVACPDNAAAVDEAAYDAHRLGLGVPGPADWGSEKTYPIEANFDLLNGIDFKKGCFVGQETTSRMKRRGQIKSRMLPLAFEGVAPNFGAEVLAGELRAGELLSGEPGRAMALVRLDRIAKAPLTVDGRPATPQPPEWLPAFEEDAPQDG